MAAYYQMGQYRYNGTDQYLVKQSSSVETLDWQFETETSPWYRDFYIKLANSEFKSGKSYYLTFSLPRDLNYNFSFALKFIKTNNVRRSEYIYSETGTTFQFIKYLEVPRTYSNGSHNSLVCLYKINGDSQPRTAVSNKVLHTDEENANNLYLNEKLTSSTPKTKDSGIFYEIKNPGASGGYTYYPGILYHNRVNDTYWMFESGTKTASSSTDDFFTNNILEGTSDVVLNWKWEYDDSADVIHYKMLVTPRKDGYDGLLFQLKRIQEDGDIINAAKVKKGTSSTQINVSGRYLDIDSTIDGSTKVKDTFNVYEVKDLNSTVLSSNGKLINRIGLWGHPELIFSINGEELKIGQSGYYELDDFEIKEFSVCATGPQDTFILDYQYVV